MPAGKAGWCVDAHQQDKAETPGPWRKTDSWHQWNCTLTTGMWEKDVARYNSTITA